MKKILSAITLLAAMCFFSGCVSDPPQEEPRDTQEIQAESGAQQKLLTFSLSGTEDGRKKWDIEAESADILDSEVVELSNIRGKTYNNESVIAITADNGTFDKKSSNVELKSNVVALTDDGARLTTDKLHWDAQREKVWTEDFVTVDRENVKASGTGITGHPALEKVKFEQDVMIDIAPSTVVTCDGPLEIDYKDSIAYLNDNVEVNDERGRLKADKARVYFDAEKKEIKKVVAEGNVSIMRGENTTYSEEAVYHANEGRVVLKGKPRLVIYSGIEEGKNGFNQNR